MAIFFNEFHADVNILGANVEEAAYDVDDELGQSEEVAGEHFMLTMLEGELETGVRLQVR